MYRSIWIPFLFFACSEYEFAGKTESTTGDPTAPQIEVNPTFVDFGLRKIEEGPTEDRIVQVENVGTATLLVRDVTPMDLEAPFHITVLSGVSLEPDEVAEFAVSWTPNEIGSVASQAHVSSDDPDNPIVAVELIGDVPEPEDNEDTGEPPSDPEVPDDVTPDIVVTPPNHDFGLLTVGDTAELRVEIRNAGDAMLIIDSIGFVPTSSDLEFEPDHAVNGAFPWHLSPGASISVWVDYLPSDDEPDHSEVIVQSNDPDSPEASAHQLGNARAFEGFSTGWYIYDDGIPYETFSSGSHVVDHHGDHDLYWYEPSGAHGMVDSSDVAGDFAILRDYVIDRAGGPSVVSGPLSFSSGSDLATFTYATFTHILCDFYLDPSEDPASYEVSAGSVDDGIEVIVNGEILGHMVLGAAPTSWSLADVARPGEVNTLVVILVDDSRVDRYLSDLAFYKDGVMVE
jgi:hypothetical protein